MNNNISVIIQGPLDETSLSNYPNYKKYGDVFISIWQNENIKKTFEKYNIDINQNVIIKDMPILPSHHGINQTSKFFYVLKSMYNILDSIKTDYIIRTRSDEKYENLDILIEKFFKNTDKLVFGNIFVRKYSDLPNHIGDHIYMVKTNIYKEMISLLINMYEKNEKYESWADQNKIPCECILANCFLKIKNINQDKWLDKNTIKDNFDLFDINKTQNFIAKWQNNNKTYINKFENQHGHFDCIEHYLS